MTQPDFFSNVIDPGTTFFNEGPVVVRKTATVFSSSIDTTLIDAYRQGVEITTSRHYTLGIVKIHSGEPGHASIKLNFGQDTELVSTFEPYSEPEEVEDLVDDSSFVPNGAIEPLSTVRVFPFTLKPFANGVRGTLLDGNENANGSDIIVSTRKFISTFNEPYVDDFALGLITASNGSTSFRLNLARSSFSPDVASFEPFNDDVVLNISTVNDITTLTSYVSYQHSASLVTVGCVCGFTYDDQPFFTDSLAFGGMTY